MIEETSTTASRKTSERQSCASFAPSRNARRPRPNRHRREEPSYTSDVPIHGLEDQRGKTSTNRGKPIGILQGERGSPAATPCKGRCPCPANRLNEAPKHP